MVVWERITRDPVIQHLSHNVHSFGIYTRHVTFGIYDLGFFVQCKPYNQIRTYWTSVSSNKIHVLLC